MHTLQNTLITILAVMCFQLQVVAGDMVATFSSLPQGDELAMRFTTAGCFHFDCYELNFHRSTSMTVSVTQIEQKWSEDRKAYITTNQINLGHLVLTKTDMDGLDRLLQFYRSSRRSGCTTIDEIAILQRHDGKVTATEAFTDASCSHDRKDLTRITELVGRLRKRK